MSEVKVKICGITRIEDALLAAELGAWAIGFVFFLKSSRAVDPKVARTIRDSLPPGLRAVGVFVDSSIETILETVRVSGVDTVQLHGDESPEFCRVLRRRLPSVSVVKALRVRDESDLRKAGMYQECDAVLLDAFVEGSHGGTGQSFDWSIAEEVKKAQLPIIVSGGLRARNVRDAIDLFEPFAVDASSGVELRPGVKDERTLREFFEAIKESA